MTNYLNWVQSASYITYSSYATRIKLPVFTHNSITHRLYQLYREHFNAAAVA